MALTVETKGKNFILYTNGYMKILNCRVSFPHLAEKHVPKEGKPSYGVTGMMPKATHVEAKDAIIAQIQKALAAKEIKAGPKNWFLYDADKRNDQNIEEGEEEVRAEYLGNYIFSAKDTKIRPKVYTARGVLVQDKDEIEELIYGGCYCHIMIQPWAYHNKDVGKKGCSSSLIGIQFVEAGESFGTSRVDDSDEWGDETDGSGAGHSDKDAAGSDGDDDF